MDGRPPPPGYGPPGYDPADDQDAYYPPSSGRLLQGMDNDPMVGAPPLQPRLSHTPNRSYQPLPYNSAPSYVDAPPQSRYSASPAPSANPFRDSAYGLQNLSSSNISYNGAASNVSYDRPYSRTSIDDGAPPWTPGHRGRQSTDWSRPPPMQANYEPADLDGQPRPRSVSPRKPARPLPSTEGFPPRESLLQHPPAAPRRDTYMSDETMVPIGSEYSDDPYSDLYESEYGMAGSSDLGERRRDRDRRRPDSPATINSEQTMTSTARDHDEEEIAKLPSTAVKAEGEHFGPAPMNRQERRGLNRQAMMTRKQVKLINGELILDCKIPSILHSFLPRRDEQEFTHMRYTAVTCDPDDFVERGYLLRQNIDPTRRETELFICITMYNEDENCFTRTMHGVMRNIAHFCSRTKSRMWGKDGWQKIVVCVVADGRKKIHPRVLDALAAIGVYQDGIAKNMVNGKAVQAHVYEYTSQVSLDSDMKFKGAEKGIVPVQMLFCLKEQNAKKLNSHRWFFNAFGAVLQPNVCILLDVGTKPGSDSLYHLWKAFDTDSNVGGACGEIKAMKGRGGLALFNPLVASQNFEYKMSNILDKPLESVFGYITVLPGALSAYRYHALQNDDTGHGPLSQYFKGETLQGKDADVFTANMYLAEDRILCWELVAKRSERWVLKYVRSATGETDVPDAVPEFVSQRRRWLNGAFFAAIYSLAHFRQIWTTDHTLLRKILLHMEFAYQALSLTFTFFSLANFYLMFYYIAGSLTEKRLDPFGHGIGGGLFICLKFICILLISTQFILCMGNRPQGAKRMFFWSMFCYGVIMAYTTFCSLYIVVKSFTGGIDSGDKPIDLRIGDNIFTNLIVSTGSTIGVYFLMSFAYLDPWHMFTSSAQYFMMLPSYICTLQVYAFCNTHDVSWGTKGDNTVSMDLGSAVATKGKDGNAVVELEMPSEQLDIDSGYDEALRNLRDRLEVEEAPPTEGQIKDDYYRAVRTYVVVVWLISNAVLAMIVTEVFKINDIGGNGYLKFTLWSIAVLAVFRMIGSFAYLVIEGLHAFVEGRYKLDPTRYLERFQPAWKRGLKK